MRRVRGDEGEGAPYQNGGSPRVKVDSILVKRHRIFHRNVRIPEGGVNAYPQEE